MISSLQVMKKKLKKRADQSQNSFICLIKFWNVAYLEYFFFFFFHV